MVSLAEAARRLLAAVLGTGVEMARINVPAFGEEMHILRTGSNQEKEVTRMVRRFNAICHYPGKPCEATCEIVLEDFGHGDVAQEIARQLLAAGWQEAFTVVHLCPKHRMGGPVEKMEEK